MRSAIAALGILALSAANRADSSAPLRMSVLGDSLAFGTGASDPANGLAFRVYRTLLAKRPGSEITNLAIGGSRAADVTRLEVPELDPASGLVLVIVGGNDVVRHTPADKFAADEMRLVAAIRARAPHATLVVCGVPDVARSPLFSDSAAKVEALSKRDDDAVRAATAAHGAAFVDLFRYTREHGTNPEFFSSDDFHPSDAGYAQLADAVVPVVERALQAAR